MMLEYVMRESKEAKQRGAEAHYARTHDARARGIPAPLL